MNFDRLSKKQKRIAVAKDVLEWLSLGRMTATRRKYLVAETLTPNGKINGYNCEACALGGLFACAVEAKKSVNLHQFRNYDNEYGTQRDMHAALSDFFDRDELMNIENAFEGRYMGSYVNLRGEFTSPKNYSSAAGRFNVGVRSPKRRMQRIMRNIIRNDGRFVP